MDSDTKKRIPPGQFVTEKFPILTYGVTPVIKTEDWKLRLFGELENELLVTWDAFVKLPQSEMISDFHCVTTWTRLNNKWNGVNIREILKLIRINSEAKWVLIHCNGGYTTNLPIEIFTDKDVMLANLHDGEYLTPDHGYPVRLIVPKKYGWKSAKWVSGIEFLKEDKLGFWEQNGYSNNADPYVESRYSICENRYDWEVYKKEVEKRKEVLGI